MNAIKLSFFNDLDPNQQPILGINLSLGPLTGEPRSYDLLLDYNGLTCSVTASQPACSTEFIHALETGFTDASSWEYDPTSDLFIAKSDIDMPLMAFTYIGSSPVMDTTIAAASDASDDDLERGVPAPFPSSVLVPLLAPSASSRNSLPS